MTRLISDDEIKSIGRNAREEHSVLSSVDIDGLDVRGGCIDISGRIKSTLIERFDISTDDIDRVRCKVYGEELHYYVRIKGTYLQSFSTNEYVVIDASADQFCDELKNVGRVDVSLGPYNSISPVQIIPPNDTRLSRYENPIIGV